VVAALSIADCAPVAFNPQSAIRNLQSLRNACKDFCKPILAFGYLSSQLSQL
jgi:hypothetical protein